MGKKTTKIKSERFFKRSSLFQRFETGGWTIHERGISKNKEIEADKEKESGEREREIDRQTDRQRREERVRERWLHEIEWVGKINFKSEWRGDIKEEKKNFSQNKYCLQTELTDRQTDG